MPTANLDKCRTCLIDSYRDRLGVDFCDTWAEVESGRRPMWRYVSGDNLTSGANAATPDAAGLLLDPEIGMLLYILPFPCKAGMRTQIMHALKLRSRLSAERHYTGASMDGMDHRGAWRVTLLWLVARGERDRWIKEVTNLRCDTGFSEEISMDAIFLEGIDVQVQLKQYDFPRLLLATREVFSKQQIEHVDQWMSANGRVESALAGFANLFTVPEERQLAEDVVRKMRDFHETPGDTDASGGNAGSPRQIRSIQVRNFRNLANFHLDLGTPSATACVVYGPNGTGKSSLCEAISLELFGSSSRYRSFVAPTEKDVTARDRKSEYLKYLTQLGQNAGPQCAINGSDLHPPRLVDSLQTDQQDLAMCGTILTQDTSLEFARLTGDALGARILRGYSSLAEHIETFVDGFVEQVNDQRQAFLKDLNIPLNVTRVDTAYAKIARREVDRSVPSLPHALVTWLDSVSKFAEHVVGRLADEWRTWGSDTARIVLGGQLADFSGNPLGISNLLQLWLRAFNQLVLGSSQVVKGVQDRCEPIRKELDHVRARITSWGEWLEKRAEGSTSPPRPEDQDLSSKLSSLQSQLQQITEQGYIQKERFEHLERIEAYIRHSWSKHHPQECPTCGAKHVEDGGVVAAISVLREKTIAERERLRNEYARLQGQIADAQRQLAVLGQEQPPIGKEEQVRLATLLNWLIPANTDFQAYIRVKANREKMSGAITALQQIPSVPPTVDAERKAEEVAKEISSQFRLAEAKFQAPDAWKSVKTKLTAILASVLQEHLPWTLERLWKELVLNLTPAPWLLPKRPHFDIRPGRREQKAMILVERLLARYVLNQSEVHILGLAWFFTQYLTLGRFHHACMVMDDPAHELDQTAFRDLCRLWETLIRLHHVYERPLQLIVMLNQESRAVEAARATGGRLAILNWSDNQRESVRITDVIGQGFHPPLPAQLFTATG